MSHDAELGHQPSLSGDVEPRLIDRWISKITILATGVIGLWLAVLMLQGNATAFWRVFLLLALPATAVMFVMRWYVRISAHRRRAARTQRQNHRFNASLAAMTIDDGAVDALAENWARQDTHEQAEAAEKAEAERAEGVEAQRQRDAAAGPATSFQARRGVVKNVLIPRAKALEPEPSTDEPEES